MNSELIQKLELVNGHRIGRQQTAHFIINNPFYFDELINMCFTISDPDSFKACYVLEFIAFEKLEWFADYLEYYCENLKFLTNESAIRPLAKITQLLLKSHYNKSDSRIQFTEKQLLNCIEVNFDWLINDSKVATKAYSMRTLFFLGKQYHWIHSDLKEIVTKDYNSHSAAYKAVARDILKKIK